MTSPKSLTQNLMIVAILGTALACSDPTGPAQEPQPQFASVYDPSVTTRYIEVRGSWQLDPTPYPAGHFRYLHRAPAGAMIGGK